MSVGIRLENIQKTYGAARVFGDLSLEICPGELFTLLGPSGCGKTTLLQIIAGLTPVDAGRVFFGGRDVTALPPRKRRVGMVFQEHTNFPSLSARRNLEIVLSSRPDRRETALRYLKLVHMEAFADRLPSELSGGQQQRVALARALCVEPDVLLLDEPLSALDPRLKTELAAMTRDLQRTLKITTVYVTHDPEEAEAVSDRIAELREGGAVQILKEPTPGRTDP